MDQRQEARAVVCLALVFYCVSIIFLTLASAADFTWGEAVGDALALCSIVLLVSYATPAITLPGERYAYLVTGWAGFTIMLMYLTTTDDLWTRRIAVVLILATGIIGAYGAYLARFDDRAPP